MLPVPYTVGVARIVLGATDAHGNPVKSWDAPVDWPVHAVVPGEMVEVVAGQDRSDKTVNLLAPSGHENEPTELDRVTINGLEYEVDGAVKNWTQGPWQWDAGVQVTCTRVEG